MKRLATLFALCLPLYCAAQTVAIKKVELAGDKIIVKYELDDSNPNNEYLMNLYISKDNYTVAMTKVKGDVGPEIKPGTIKTIEWNFKEELVDYSGEIALEVRGKVFIMFAKLQGFSVEKSYKRGKTYPLDWKPGNNNPIHIELFKGSERIVGELNHPNNGSYLLTMPAHAKPGNDYRIRLTDSKRPDEIIYTGFFKVTPKFPMLLKAAVGVIVIGGVIVAVSGGGSKGGTTPIETSSKQPDPLSVSSLGN
jgi:hypothetical protein